MHRPCSRKSAQSRVLEKFGLSRSWQDPCAEAQLLPRVQDPAAKNLHSRVFLRISKRFTFLPNGHEDVAGMSHDIPATSA